MVAQTCNIIGVYPSIHKQYRLLRCPITHRLASGILALRVHAKKEQLKAPLHGEAKRTLPDPTGQGRHTIAQCNVVKAQAGERREIQRKCEKGRQTTRARRDKSGGRNTMETLN